MGFGGPRIDWVVDGEILNLQFPTYIAWTGTVKNSARFCKRFAESYRVSVKAIEFSELQYLYAARMIFGSQLSR